MTSIIIFNQWPLTTENQVQNLLTKLVSLAYKWHLEDLQEWWQFSSSQVQGSRRELFVFWRQIVRDEPLWSQDDREVRVLRKFELTASVYSLVSFITPQLPSILWKRRSIEIVFCNRTSLPGGPELWPIALESFLGRFLNANRLLIFSGNET